MRRPYLTDRVVESLRIVLMNLNAILDDGDPDNESLVAGAEYLQQLIKWKQSKK